MTATVTFPIQMWYSTLTPEVKGQLFQLILEELLAQNGDDSPILCHTVDGKMLGTFTPLKVHQRRADNLLAELPVEEREQFLQAVPADFDSDDCLTESELATISRSGSE
jgi:hypothetical protein